MNINLSKKVVSSIFMIVMIMYVPLSTANASNTALNKVFQECAKGSYKNISGNCVHSSQKASAWPTGASAKCRDGTYSYSQHRSGTCSHHGGVATWHF